MIQDPLFLPHYLAREGIIRRDYDEARCAFAANMFHQNSGLQEPAAILAMLHPYALDYIRQAPVLVPMLAKGKRVNTVNHAGTFALRHENLFDEGPKLRELLEKHKALYGLRALKAPALRRRNYLLLRDLFEAEIDPSTLAQIIPKHILWQQRWLTNIGVWASHMRARTGSPTMLRWATITLAPHNRISQRITEVVDYMFAHQGDESSIWTRDWTWQQALDAAERWHQEMGSRADRDFQMRHGVAFDHEIDYAPFANEPREAGGYILVPLRSGKALHEEGREMRHCVGTYAGDVITGRSRIFSITKDGERVATAEFRKDGAGPIDYNIETKMATAIKWRVYQCKGPCNSEVSPEIRELFKGYWSAP